MEFKTVFVTVGTTSFDELIGEVNTRRMVELLKTIGCKRLIIQYGRGPEIHLDEGMVWQYFNAIRNINMNININTINIFRTI